MPTTRISTLFPKCGQAILAMSNSTWINKVNWEIQYKVERDIGQALPRNCVGVFDVSPERKLGSRLHV